MSQQDPLGAPHAGHADPRGCPGCALLKEQLSTLFQAENNPALWEVLGTVPTHEEYGHPDDARPPHETDKP